MIHSKRIFWFDPDDDSALIVSDVFGDLCALFCGAAMSVWHDLRDTRNRGSALSEDSITDYLLLNMKRRSSLLTYHRYNRHDESHVSGADWLWFFVAKGRYFALLVQAKRLYRSHRYEKLKHSPTDHSDQLSLLERHAQNNGLYPLICFYNYWQSHQHWAASRFAGNQQLWGCAVAPVADVKSTLGARSGNSLAMLGPRSFPWHVLVCPGAGRLTSSTAGPNELPDQVRDRVIRVFDPQAVPPVRENLPANIEELLTTDSATLLKMVGIAGDLQESLSGIVVIGEDGVPNQ